ncbi:hypothetical protein [Mammaliicoccus sciuri]|uniref:hypothetical protein n=1 Tax=Mammaliicoccus sciuri TaxID=1296 RepID=UPI001071CA01|nr:hypothetical protein [Mammaliicoccus sciuri]MBF0720429.1 hypothetical protein [Mammaliicoccus sciuri]MBF0773133.1 hypothetical protein [Mammaliicoccus sciuri]MBO1208922.1 hypothetical protein [Mammaliicoccus sciuri]MBU6088348.1 hypothetical protein [Mammaliicoccus sciuri]MBW3109111.1 hypothetical protein [Mammaliicoccus sciuri]
MDKIERIIKTIDAEKNRSDKQFKGIEFNIRKNEVVMIYNYDEMINNVKQDPHYIRHNKDPEWLSLDELTAIQKALKEKNIHFIERRDEFM